MVWRYSLPNIRGEGWCLAILDSTEFLAICSDWGNYAFNWNGNNGDFREFFCKLNADYVAGKLCPSGRHSVYDGDKTERKILDHILKERRCRNLTAEEAREEWDDVCVTNEMEFWDWVRETKIEKAHEFGVYGLPSDLKGFVKNCLPRLQELIRQDMAAG